MSVQSPSRNSLPVAPRSVPLLGHLLPMLRDPLAFLTSLPAHGDLVRISLGPASAVVVCDPELTRQVLVDDRTFDKGGPLFNRLREMLGDGLATCPHSRHRRQRRLLQPGFHRERLPGYAGTMTGNIDAVTGSWHDGQVLDVHQELTRFTLKTLTETVFSDALPPPVFHQTVADFRTVLGGGYLRVVLPPLWSRLPTPANRRYHQAISRMRQAVGQAIRSRQAEGTDPGDLLSALLNTRDPAHRDSQADDRGMTDEEISDQIITFFLAGTETTATTLAWTMHLLACHPGIEERVQAEADSVLAGAPAGWEHLPELRLTSRVVTEAMRLYPPGWIVTRTVASDTRLGNHPLPAGTNLIYSPYVIQRQGEVYPDPERFDPDRWDSGHRAQPPRTSFLAFGGGARKCIGDAFGVTEAVLSVATIAARWNLRGLPGRRVRPVPSIALTPGGLRLRVAARTRPAGTA
jgi:cytochrome P450